MENYFVPLLFLGSVLLMLSIFASKSSQRFGVPTLIVFLAVGMLAGYDGPGGIYFDDPQLAQLLGIVALNYILFSGGLETKWESIRPIFYQGLSLSTIGVLITAGLTGVFAHYLLDFSIAEGLLLGAIVSSTDAAAVFSILRSRGVGLKHNLRPTLEFESGSNDPMAYFLTTSFLLLVQQPETSFISLVGSFFLQMSIGGLMGYLMGKLMVKIINYINLEVEGLYPVLMVAFVFFTYSGTELLYGNGFLSVYVSAIVLGNASFIHKKSSIRFFDAIAWLMQIVMFLILGLLVFPSQLIPTMTTGLAIALFLIFIARPLAVFISLSLSRQNFKDKLFVSWVGLRGAVPIIFATYPLLAGVEKAQVIFNLVFFISILSVTLQGTSLPTVARWLNLSVKEAIRRKYPMDLEWSNEDKTVLEQLTVTVNSRAHHTSIVDLNFPKNGLIVMIKRGTKYLTPNGSSVLQAGDILTIMANSEEDIESFRQILCHAPEA